MKSAVGQALREHKAVERGQEQQHQEQSELNQRHMAILGAQQAGQAAHQRRDLHNRSASQQQDGGETDWREISTC